MFDVECLGVLHDVRMTAGPRGCREGGQFGVNNGANIVDNQKYLANSVQLSPVYAQHARLIFLVVLTVGHHAHHPRQSIQDPVLCVFVYILIRGRRSAVSVSIGVRSWAQVAICNSAWQSSIHLPRWFTVLLKNRDLPYLDVSNLLQEGVLHLVSAKSFWRALRAHEHSPGHSKPSLSNPCSVEWNSAVLTVKIRVRALWNTTSLIRRDLPRAPPRQPSERRIPRLARITRENALPRQIRLFIVSLKAMIIVSRTWSPWKPAFCPRHPEYVSCLIRLSPNEFYWDLWQ
jgi:hypothetical protein